MFKFKTIYENSKFYHFQEIIKTVRAIIFIEHKILLVYSKIFNDMMFPGGTINKNEDKKSALIRELKEELGCEKVESIKFLGETKEVCYKINDQAKLIKRKSYYYLCKIDQLGKQNLEDYEILYGLEPKLYQLTDAIKHLQAELKIRLQKPSIGLITTIKREIKVLKYLRRNYARVLQSY